MDLKEKDLLEETVELGKGNRKILRKLLVAHHRSIFIFWVKWAIIGGLAVGGYYYLQPFIEAFSGAYGELGDRIDAIIGFNKSLNPLNLIKKN